MPNQGTIPLQNNLVRKGFGDNSQILPGEGALYLIEYETNNGTISGSAVDSIELVSTSNALLNIPYHEEVIFDITPEGYFARHASRAWTSGGQNFRLQLQIESDNILFLDEQQIEESDGNCENPEQNILQGIGPVGPFFTDSSNLPRFILGRRDGPTFTTTCVNGPYQVNLFLRVSRLSNDDIAIDSGSYPGVTVTLLEDYNELLLSEALMEEQGNTNALTFINSSEEVLIDEEGNTNASTFINSAEEVLVDEQGNTNVIIN